MDKSKVIDILLLREKISLNEVLKGHIDYGKIKYDSQGLLICHICGKSFRSLSGHIWNKHNIKSRDYKMMFGLNLKTSLICEDTKELKRTYIDGDTVEHLLKVGNDTRFNNGHKKNLNMFKNTKKYVSKMALENMSKAQKKEK